MEKKTAAVLEQMLKKIASLESMVDDWKFYDIGRVAENKSRSTNDILVYLPTHMAEMSGKGSVEDREEEVTFKDEEENDVTIKITHTTAVKAIWLPMGDRSENAPDVRKNERVFIYRWADSETLYWVPSNLDSHLRRLETRTLLFSADPDGTSNTPRNADNSYALHISTHDRIVRFTTTNLNGEPFTYTIELDTEKGSFTIVDDVGNVIRIDSANTKILLENKDETRVVLHEKNIEIYAPENIDITADKDIIVQCENFTMNCNADFKVTAQKGTFDIPTTTFTGAVTVVKGVDAATMESKGTLSVMGTSTFSAPMTANGIVSAAPIKGPNDSI